MFVLAIFIEPLAHGGLEGFGEIVTVMIVNALHGGDRVSEEFGVLDVEDLALNIEEFSRIEGSNYQMHIGIRSCNNLLDKHSYNN